MKFAVSAVTREYIYHEFFPLITELKVLAKEAGHELDVDYIPNSTLIDHVRSRVANISLEQGADVMLIIDDDVTYRPADALKLILKAAELKAIVAAPVAIRGGGYNVAFLKKKVGFFSRGGLYPIQKAGCGLTAVHRSVYERLAETMPRVLIGNDDKLRYPFYRSGFFKVDGMLQWKGEDWTFSMRAYQAGIPLWCDTTIRTLHHFSSPTSLEDAKNRTGMEDGFWLDFPSAEAEESELVEDWGQEPREARRGKLPLADFETELRAELYARGWRLLLADLGRRMVGPGVREDEHVWVIVASLLNGDRVLRVEVPVKETLGQRGMIGDLYNAREVAKDADGLLQLKDLKGHP